jgi:hypothetical protein
MGADFPRWGKSACDEPSTLTPVTEKEMLTPRKNCLTKANRILIFIAKGCMSGLLQRENYFILLFSKKEVL